MSAAERVLDTAKTDLATCESLMIKSGVLGRPHRATFMQMARDASIATRQALERFEREVEKELFE